MNVLSLTLAGGWWISTSLLASSGYYLGRTAAPAHTVGEGKGRAYPVAAASRAGHRCRSQECVVRGEGTASHIYTDLELSERIAKWHFFRSLRALIENASQTVVKVALVSYGTSL